MDLMQFYLMRHRSLHNTAGTIYVDFTTISDEHMRAIPHPALNSIAWLLWHIGRVEDVAINRMVTDGVQVLNNDDWPARMNIDRFDVGTGMSEEQVAELSAIANLDAIKLYWDAVGARTRTVIEQLQPDVLDELVGDEHLARVFVNEGVLGPNALWVHESGIYRGLTRGLYLGHWALGHSYMHYGEMNTIRSLLGIRTL